MFHGKLYIVERASQGDTVSIMGSPNWSVGALFGSGSHANTEVASISRCPGWHWDEKDTGQTDLAARLSQTAQRLFTDPQRTRLLTSWSDTGENLPEITELLALLAAAESRSQNFGKREEPETLTQVVKSIDPDLQPLARGLVSLIERTLGIGPVEGARRYIEEHLRHRETSLRERPSSRTKTVVHYRMPAIILPMRAIWVRGGRFSRTRRAWASRSLPSWLHLV